MLSCLLRASGLGGGDMGFGAKHLGSVCVCTAAAHGAPGTLPLPGGSPSGTPNSSCENRRRDVKAKVTQNIT